MQGNMAFSSWRFGIFVAAAFAAYYLPAFTNFQVRLLVSASIFFYDYGQPELLPLPLAALPGTRLFLTLAFRNRAVWMPAASCPTKRMRGARAVSAEPRSTSGAPPFTCMLIM
jgi:hypothetical protein